MKLEYKSGYEEKIKSCKWSFLEDGLWHCQNPSALKTLEEDRDLVECLCMGPDFGLLGPCQEFEISEKQ